MSSFWNKNIALFCSRFPALASQYGLTPAAPEPVADSLPFTPSTAKNGEPTALWQGKALHSSYNPSREAEGAARSLHKEGNLAAVFFGFGLGYLPAAYARLFPGDTLLLIEPSADWFFAALTAFDWSGIFSAPNLVLALQAGVDSLIPLVEKAGGGSLKNVGIFSNAAFTAHAADYFAALTAALKRTEKKEAVNTFTLEKFSKLWLKNSCRNLASTARLSGVLTYKDACLRAADATSSQPLPALVLAAGPTLQEVLPHLAELKKRMLVIAVDTALRACLQTGVEPDFILLVDPQYYAWRHIAGLSAPSSVLITESAAYPPAFRFPCRRTVLCSSLFPLGKYFEKRLGSKGQLAAGGSVSTTAWDFARLCGARRIYMAGLDLGYPGLETHIRGSTFEERLHASSRRTRPAETGGAATLFGANMRHARSYAGDDILTDDRMQLFAWWFESKQEEYAASGIQTYSLSPRSLAIPGLQVASVESLLSEAEREMERAAFFAVEQTEAADKAEAGIADARAANGATARDAASAKAAAFQTARAQLLSGLESLYQTARQGLSLCDQALLPKARAQKVAAFFAAALEAIDREILTSELKEIAALVFPTQRQLEAIYESQTFSPDAMLASFQQSKIIYRELQKSIKSYLNYL